jgi:glycosyltransferase involved in cell wall biosynthesis
VAGLLPQYPDLSYRLIGMSRDRRYVTFLRKLIDRVGLGGRAELMHAASDAVKFAALRHADLYVQPSHEEGFCIAFIEAAMVAPRLVGADTGEIAAIAAGDPWAAVVPPMNPAGIEAAARRLLAMTPPPGAVAERRQRLATRYSWDRYLDQHAELYDSVLGHTGGPDGVVPAPPAPDVAGLPAAHSQKT